MIASSMPLRGSHDRFLEVADLWALPFMAQSHRGGGDCRLSGQSLCGVARPNSSGWACVSVENDTAYGKRKALRVSAGRARGAHFAACCSRMGAPHIPARYDLEHFTLTVMWLDWPVRPNSRVQCCPLAYTNS